MENNTALVQSGGERALEKYITANFNSALESFNRLKMGEHPIIKQRREVAETLGLENLSPTGLNLPKRTHIYPNAYEGYGIREFFDSVMFVASKNKEEVLLSLVDAKNLGGVNDEYGLAAGDLYLLACICIMRQAFGTFFENVTILRRTNGDEFWVVCSVRKNIKQSLENLPKLLSFKMEQLEHAVGFKVLENPKRQSDKGIGLHFALITSLSPKVRAHHSLVKGWGEMIDYCERRFKST